jgi:hypothetical protein
MPPAHRRSGAAPGTSAKRGSAPSRRPLNRRIRGVAGIIAVQLAVLAGANVAFGGDEIITGLSSTGSLFPGLPFEGGGGCQIQREVTGGGVKLSEPSEDLVLGSFPSRDIEWLGVGLRPTDFSDPRQITGFARCEKRLGNVINKAKTRPLLNNGSPVVAVARCPQGTTLTGGGIDLGRGIQTLFGIGVADGFSFPIASFPTGRRGWAAIAVRSGAPDDAEITSRASCLRPGARIVRRQHGEGMPADGGVHTAKATCPRGTDLTGGGWRVTELDGSDLIKGTFPQGERTWVVKGMSGGPEPSQLTAYALCLK